MYPLFIDTGVLLSFYRFTKEDLEELRKLIVLLEQKELRLMLPDQVISEFRRNREGTIADSLKRLKEQKLNLEFPQICKDYPMYAQLRELQGRYQQCHADLLKALSDDIERFALKADEIIKRLFQLAKRVECSEGILRRASDRMDRGNPPGKKGSLGDALNWEALLEAVPDKKDLYFISEDPDYRSPLADGTLNGFLNGEWGERKGSRLIFYQHLSEFFKEHFPHIQLAHELRKDLLIRDLALSGSFARTHELVNKLSKWQDFTPTQRNAIVQATLQNSQIHMIVGDPDVHDFLHGVIHGYEKLIGEGDLHMMQSLLAPPETTQETGEEDLPF